MSKKKGYVKFYRATQDHWLWNDKPFSKGQAWADLLLSANHAPAKFEIEGQLIKLNRGQQARSKLTLSKAWGWSRGKVDRFLNRLEEEGMIVYKTSQLTTLISICNYSEFQDLSTSDRTTDGQRTDNGQDTNKNVLKNEKNKPEPAASYPQAKVLALFIEQRLEEQNRLIREVDQNKWANDVQELITVKKISYPDVIELFEWANNHSFWGNKILSPGGLFKNYEMLVKQRNQRPLLKLPADLNELTQFAETHNLPSAAPGTSKEAYKRALATYIRENLILEGVIYG